MRRKPNRTVSKLPTTTHTAAEEPSSPVARTQPLRRWSVAELIARAVPAPPVDRASQ